MRSYRKELWFNTESRRAYLNITPEINACLRGKRYSGWVAAGECHAHYSQCFYK